MRPGKTSGISRRTLVGAAASSAFALANASAATAALKPTWTASQAARKQATPEAEYNPSRHSYPLVQEKKKLTIMVPTYLIDWANNDMTRWYEELTNVEVEWVVIPDEGASTQLNLRLASGDYPDAIMGFLWSPFELSINAIMALGQTGQLIDLQPYLADNAPNLREIVYANYPDAEAEMTLPGGAVFSLGQLNDCFHCRLDSTKFWIHTDWLETLGLEMPNTLEEMTAVLQAFRDGDPNGNGLADEVPLLGDVVLTPRRYFQAAFGPNPDQTQLYRNDGVVTAAYTDESWREMTRYLAELNQLGLFGIESFTRSNDDSRELGINRQVGSAGAGQPGWWYTRTPEFEDLTRAYQMVPPLLMPDGNRLAFRNYNVMARNAFVVTDQCEDPALAVAWADGLYAWEMTMRAQFGVPDRDWKMADEGQLGIDGNPARVQRIPRDPAPAGTMNTSNWNQLNPTYRSSEDRLGWAVLGDRELDLEVILFENCSEALEPYATPPEMAIGAPVFQGDAAVRLAELEIGIIELREAQFAQWVTNQAPLDATWEAYQEQMRMLGLDEYLQIYQDAVDA